MRNCDGREPTVAVQVWARLPLFSVFVLNCLAVEGLNAASLQAWGQRRLSGRPRRDAEFGEGLQIGRVNFKKEFSTESK